MLSSSAQHAKYFSGNLQLKCRGEVRSPDRQSTVRTANQQPTTNSWFLVRHRRPTAHARARYRCFLPDLAGLAGTRCAGPMPDNLILASAFRVSVDVRTGRPYHSRRDAGATRTFRTLPFVRQIANNNQIACFWLILNPEQSHCARRFSATSKSHCICSCSPGSALWLQLGESIFPPCCWRALPCSSVDICSLRGAPS